jgi:hypothetical protein
MSAGIAVAVATNITTSQSFIENTTELSGMSGLWAKCFPCLVLSHYSINFRDEGPTADL